MNDGFFSSSQLKTYNKKKPLPPQLNKDFPPEKEPTIKVKNNPSKKNQAILDIECYVNYFLVKFMILSDDSFIEFERTEYQELDYTAIENIIKKYEIITFNGINYDIPILRLALTGATCKELKNATNRIIRDKMNPWTFIAKYDLPKFKIKHIDIKEIPKGFISLKMYAGRLHCKKMQDLPYPEDSVLTEHQMDMVAEYCGNDCENTKLVMYDLLSQIELRRYMSKKYKIDLMSKSDAQIAEAVFKEEYFNITKKEVEKPEVYSRQFFYQVPDFINFTHPELKKILDVYTNEPVKADSAGNISMNSISGMKVKVGYSTYKIGIGGLHSQEKRAFHVADNDFILSDFDVSSFYPKVILNCGLYPKQMGKVYTQIYDVLVDTRLTAKDKVKEIKKLVKTNKTKELQAELEKYTADTESLKTVINGSFGKLGSAYSILYAPDLMIQVTVTGQLSLLMLIEMMENKGLSVVSGNTDGIVIKCPKEKESLMNYIIKRWETITGFSMEETKYAGIFSRDINNYIAVKPDGEVKLKGVFKPADIEKNPANEICSIAMVAYLKYGTPFEDTIRNCQDITKFVTIQHVNGGASKDGVFLGKSVRFYHAVNETGAIYDCGSNKKVDLTDGAKPIMDLSVPFPNDIDYQWYVNNCYDLFGK